jgi:nitroreductase
MDVLEAMTKGGTGRYYKSDPVPDEVIRRALDAARFAPNGGNRQPIRWVVVRDAERRKALADLYLPHWKADLAQYLGGDLTTGSSSLNRAVEEADHFAEHFHEVPVIFVACARLEDMHPAAFDDGRPNMVAGASIYTHVQSLCLALRADGVATTITTLICKEEPRAAEVLGLPDGVVTACHVAAGYPERGFPTRLQRLPVDEIAFGERYGEAL